MILRLFLVSFSIRVSSFLSDMAMNPFTIFMFPYIPPNNIVHYLLKQGGTKAHFGIQVTHQEQNVTFWKS